MHPSNYNPSYFPSVPPAPKRRRTPWLALGAASVAAMMLAALMIGGLVLVYLTPARLPSGVSVAGLVIGGETREDAAQVLGQRWTNGSVTVTDGNRQWTVTLRDLGVGLDVDATLQAAQNATPGSAVVPRLVVDLNQTQAGLIALSAQTNIAAVPGNPPQMGRAMEIPVILDRLRADATGELADGVLELNMIEVEPPPPETGSNYSGETTIHVVESGQELALIAREYGVDMNDIVALNSISDPDLLYVGQELIVPAAGVYTPSPDKAPPAPLSTGKSMVVSTTEQRIYAYENGQLIRSHLVSTGRSETPTVLGDYKVYVKYTADDMSGPGYFLPQVPYTMYFYQGYAVHGTYWHNSFGRPMSHGCVNLPVDEAAWFFNWAEVGTLVRVI